MSNTSVAQPFWLWGRRASRLPAVESAGRMPAGRTGWEAYATMGHEKFLAGETGALLLFVVGFCRGGPDELDGRPQLHRAK